MVPGAMAQLFGWTLGFTGDLSGEVFHDGEGVEKEGQKVNS